MDYKDYLDKGITLTNEGKFDEAAEALNKAEELKSDDALIYFSKGIVFHNLHELETAYENYTKAIKLDNKMIDAYYNRAQILLTDKNANEKKLKTALKDLEKSIELDGKFIDAFYYAAVVNMKLKKYKEAIKLLDRVLAIEPNAIYSKALKKLIETKYL